MRKGPGMGIGQPPTPQLNALPPGTILQRRYRIQRYVGGGGFGYIYQAYDLELGHRRAIKEAFCRDDDAREQFRLEGEFLINVRHPNLVRGYALFEERQRLYLVMDYVDGDTLEDIAIAHIRRTGLPVPEAQVLDWMIPICEAVDALHDQPYPIIHRDIKPANIKLSTSQNVPILIDLGLAKLHATGSQTLAAALAFTPGYAPPEQYQASGATDERTDVYGLGASLFFLLTGYQPTEAPARLSGQALPDPTMLNPSLSAESGSIVRKAMALGPAERFQSALEVAEALHVARAALGRTAITPYTSMDSGKRLALQLCGRCRTANPRTARYCMDCGTPLGDFVPPAARSWEAAPPGQSGQPGQHEQRTGVRNGRSTSRPRIRSHGRSARPLSTAVALSAIGGSTPTLPSIGSIGGASEREAWASIFALLAAVCAAISIAGAFQQGLLIFIVPALILAGWSLAQPADDLPREFRWLAWSALALGILWLIVCFITFLIAHI